MRPEEHWQGQEAHCTGHAAVFGKRPEVCELTLEAISMLMRDFKGSGVSVRAWLNGLSQVQLQQLASEAEAAGQREVELPEPIGRVLLLPAHLQLTWRPGTLGWVPLIRGSLALAGAPNEEAARRWAREGANVVVSLLRDDEPRCDSARKACEDAGMRWEHCPLSGKRGVTAPTSHEDRGSLARVLELLPELLGAGESVVVHCAAGMHRTGAVAFCVVRRCGFSTEQALAAVERMRPVTHKALLETEKKRGQMALWEVVETSMFGLDCAL